MRNHVNPLLGLESKNDRRRESFGTLRTSESKYTSLSVKTMKTEVAKIRKYRRALLSTEERANGRLKNADAARRRDRKTQEKNSKLILERFGLAVRKFKKAQKLYKDRQVQRDSRGIDKYAKQISVYRQNIQAHIEDYRLRCRMLKLPDRMARYAKYFDSRRAKSNQESRHDGQRTPSGKLPITGRTTFVVAENTSGPSQAPPFGDSKIPNGQFNPRSTKNVTRRSKKRSSTRATLEQLKPSISRGMSVV